MGVGEIFSVCRRARKVVITNDLNLLSDCDWTIRENAWRTTVQLLMAHHSLIGLMTNCDLYFVVIL